jgi:arabinan endo-1,5-alpha-L-arabinosidase
MQKIITLPEPSYSGFVEPGRESIINKPELWGEVNSHDPAIFKDGENFFVYSTDAGVGNVHKSGAQIRTSKDLITWTYYGPAIPDYAAECAEAVEHAKLDIAKNQGFWAPDVYKAVIKNDKTETCVYRMYFSASTFGSTRSAIGLAEADNPLGPFKYKGIVVKSDAGARTLPNAIDAQIAFDRNGNVYMSWGSFFGGIWLAKIDEQTGFLDPAASIGRRKIAGGRMAAIEGSVIRYIKESDYFYLFVSYGSLSKDYNIRVGRSRDIAGPYLDANGNDLGGIAAGSEDSAGTKLMGGYTFKTLTGDGKWSKGYMAPGHNSILINDSDDGPRGYFIIHHVRTYQLPVYWFSMNVRRFYLNKFGWPVVAPQRYYGESLEKVPGTISGDFALIEHKSDSNGESRDSVPVTLSGGVIEKAPGGGVYKIYDDFHAEVVLDGVLYDGYILQQYDFEQQKPCTSIFAASERGETIWLCTQF